MEDHVQNRLKRIRFNNEAEVDTFFDVGESALKRLRMTIGETESFDVKDIIRNVLHDTGDIAELNRLRHKMENVPEEIKSSVERAIAPLREENISLREQLNGSNMKTQMDISGVSERLQKEINELKIEKTRLEVEMQNLRETAEISAKEEIRSALQNTEIDAARLRGELDAVKKLVKDKDAELSHMRELQLLTSTNRYKGVSGEVIVDGLLREAFPRNTVQMKGDQTYMPFDIIMTTPVNQVVGFEVKRVQTLKKDQIDDFKTACSKASDVDLAIMTSLESTIPTVGHVGFEVYSGTKVRAYLCLRDMPPDSALCVIHSIVLTGLAMVEKLKSNLGHSGEHDIQMTQIGNVLSNVVHTMNTVGSQLSLGLSRISSQATCLEKSLSSVLGDCKQTILDLMKAHGIYGAGGTEVDASVVANWMVQDTPALSKRLCTQSELFEAYQRFVKEHKGSGLIGVSDAKALFDTLLKENLLTKAATSNKGRINIFN